MPHGDIVEKRKAISKKVRFEVFKRDAFACQYCGCSAPDVVLNVDHIIPVASGGDSGVINLVTACFSCNSGKGKRELSDSTVVKKQAEQLKILAERRSQIEMMSAWRAELLSQDEKELGILVASVNKHIFEAGRSVTEVFIRSDLKKCLKKYGLDDSLDAVEKSAMQYLHDIENENHREKYLLMIPRICYWAKREKENPVEADLRKMAYTANKIWWKCRPQELSHRLIKLHGDGVSKESLYQFVTNSTGIMQFEDKVDEHFGGQNG